MNELSNMPELDEMEERLLVIHMRMSHRKIHQYQGERRLGYHIHGILLVWHLKLSPNLLQLLGTLDILS